MAVVVVEREIRAGVVRVWDVVTDIGRSPAVLSAVDAVRVLDWGRGRDERMGVGTRWQETRTLNGRPATEEMWVTESTPLAALRIEADSHDNAYVTDFRFHDAGTREGRPSTILTVSFGVQPRQWLQRRMAPLTMRLVRGTVVRSLRRDLADIAAAAERSSRTPATDL